MVDELALKQIFSLQSATWTIAALIALFIIRLWNGAPAMFAQWVEWRKAVAEAKTAEASRVAAEKAADWSRLRDEIVRLSDAERKCREDFDALHERFIEREKAHFLEMGEVKNELSVLRGYMEGLGNARQEASGIVAIERAHRTAKRDEPPNP